MTTQGRVIPIRRAGPRDAQRLAEVGAATFTETFGRRYPAADLAAFLDESHSPARYAGFLADPAYAAFLAEQDGEPVGYALAGPCHLPHPAVTARCGELWRLYVRGELQGEGLGGRLLEAALGWLAAPDRRLWIGVWSENHGAQRLYARLGFERVGAYQFPVGRCLDDEFILARPAP